MIDKKLEIENMQIDVFFILHIMIKNNMEKSEDFCIDISRLKENIFMNIKDI